MAELSTAELLQMLDHFGDAKESLGAKSVLRSSSDETIAYWDDHAADLRRQLRAEIERLSKPAERELAKANSLVYVPGAWKCAKCALRIVSSTLSAVDGSITSNNDPHVCPNGCGPMWRVTERDERKDAYETVELWVGKAQKAEAERDELRRKYDELLRLSHEAIRA